jgi:hypothetical protein
VHPEARRQFRRPVGPLAALAEVPVDLLQPDDVGVGAPDLAGDAVEVEGAVESGTVVDVEGQHGERA